MPSQALNVITKSARFWYSASYAAVSSVTVSKSPVPPSCLDHRLERRAPRSGSRIRHTSCRRAPSGAWIDDDCEHGDLLRRVLEDRHRALDRRAGRDRERERVLEADPALGLVGGEDRLGRRAAVGQHLELDAGVRVPALRLARRRTRGGSCSASSRARGGPWSRARPGSTGRPTTAPRRTGPPTRARCGRGRSRRRRDGRRARAAARGDDEARRRRRGRGCGSVCTARRPHVARDPAREQRSPPREPGTASTNRAGLLPTPVRTGSGSAGLWSDTTLSAHTALPGGGYSVVEASLHRGPDRRDVDLDPCGRGGRRARRRGGR